MFKRRPAPPAGPSAFIVLKSVGNFRSRAFPGWSSGLYGVSLELASAVNGSNLHELDDMVTRRPRGTYFSPNMQRAVVSIPLNTMTRRKDARTLYSVRWKHHRDYTPGNWAFGPADEPITEAEIEQQKEQIRFRQFNQGAVDPIITQLQQGATKPARKAPKLFLADTNSHVGVFTTEAAAIKGSDPKAEIFEILANGFATGVEKVRGYFDNGWGYPPGRGLADPDHPSHRVA